MLRVLVHLGSYKTGIDPYLYIIENLKGRFEWVIATQDEQVAQHIEALGGEVFIYGTPKTALPKWVTRLKSIRYINLIWQLFIGYHDNRTWSRGAQEILAATQPDVLFLSSDYRGIDAHLCLQAHQPVVIPQITNVTYLMPKAMRDYFELKPHILKPIAQLTLEIASILLRRPLLYQVGPYRILPDGTEFGFTLGSALGGMRYKVPLKGAFADHLCLCGTIYHDFFTLLDINATMHDTGNPLEDEWFAFKSQFDAAMRSEFRQHYQIPPDATTITFFIQGMADQVIDGLQPYFDETGAIIKTLLNLSPDVVVMVKVHPRGLQTLPDFQDHPRVRFVRSPTAGNETLNNKLILDSRFSITINSTTGLNVLALERPLLTYNYSGLDLNDFYHTVGCSLHATDQKTFDEHAEKLFHDAEFRAAQLAKQAQNRTHVVMADGHSTQRVGDVIEAAAQQHQRA